MDKEVADRAVLTMAELTKREEARRHRDVQAAIEDFEGAGEDERPEEAINLIMRCRNVSEEYNHRMGRGMMKMIESITGKSLAELAEQASEQGGLGLGLEMGPDGIKVLDDGEAEADTAPVGEDSIPGIAIDQTAAGTFESGDLVTDNGTDKGIVVGDGNQPGQYRVRFLDDAADRGAESIDTAKLRRYEEGE